MYALIKNVLFSFIVWSIRYILLSKLYQFYTDINKISGNGHKVFFSKQEMTEKALSIFKRGQHVGIFQLTN